MPSTTLNREVAEALEGRVPVLPRLRLYSSFGGLTWSFAAIGCASYAYLVGTSLATLGNTHLAVTGYWLGNVIGLALVMLAIGVPCFRHGIDTVDAAKSALGVRGALLLMLGVIVSCIGWGNVLIAMTARSAGAIGSLVFGRGAETTGSNEVLVEVVGCALSLVVWALVLRGPRAVESLNRWCAPGLAAVAILLLILLFHKYSLSTVMGAHMAQPSHVPADPHLQFTLAIEYGLDNGLAMIPFLGGLTRLVAGSRILASPPIIGFAGGASFVSGIAAFAAAASGVADPLGVLTIVAGPRVAAGIMAFLIIANVGAMVTFIYLAGISIQQLRPFSRLPWPITTGLLLVPSLLVSFNTQWMLSAVMSLLTYNGVFFVGLTGILLADYYLLRRQHIVVPHLFTRSPRGLYWYSGGVNWLALFVAAAITALYLTMYNPVSGVVSRPFRAVGAAAPLVLLALLVYTLLAKFMSAISPPDATSEEIVSIEL